MTSITIELTGSSAEKLRRLSEAEHRSEAEIVGDALEIYAPTKRKLPTGAGEYRSGQADLAQTDEHVLRSAVREGKWP
jgi:predicted transcriptional regulator